MICKIRDIEVYYEVHGEGIPIIMLHGWGVDHRILKGWIEPAILSEQKKFKRIYIDLPGMGKTAVNDSVKTSDDMRDLLLGFINRIIPDENYVLIGKSYGGYLARGIAYSDKNHVIGMCLLCPLVFVETQLSHAPEKSVLEVEPGIREMIPKEEWEFFDLFHVRQTKAVWEKYKEHILPATKNADFNFLDNVLEKGKKFKKDIDSAKNNYDFPALFIAGRQDWCVGYSDLFSILEQYKVASFVVVNNAGHNIEYEQTDILKTHFLKWLNETAIYEKK